MTGPYGRPVGGSSPLARGLRRLASPLVELSRIIPARAGFTGAGPRGPLRRGDHPRSRGVYAHAAMITAEIAGSSPLARGLRCPYHPGPRPGRIIPARAGFTRVRVVEGCRRRDHPRSRGVYGGVLRPTAVQVGSSPLARGLLEILSEAVEDLGIIPARAGFTRRPRGAPRSSGDHPRSRGVYTWRSLESQRSLTLPDGFRLHC